MPSVNAYAQSYIDGCRSKVKLHLAAYKNLAVTARSQYPAQPNLTSALESFEPVFFNNMVLVIDKYFIHRNRDMELSDGNPLNEVRILSHSMITHNNKFTPHQNIQYIPEKSVLKYKTGDEIKLSEGDFTKLYKAYFEEIENKYL